MPNLIYGDQFEKLCDYVCHGIALETVQNSPNLVPGCKLMFCEGHNIGHAIEHIKRMQHETFVLVSHNSDANILDHTARNFDYHYVESKIPGNIKKIYAQNLNVLSDRIRPLPIGLENYKWHKGQKWHEIESMIPQVFKRDCRLYINHAIATNPIEREEPYRLFRGKSWATSKGKVSYLEYLTDLKTHKYRICPFGNGLDTHSIWETLYMGCIPVVKKAVFTDVFSRTFPMVIVNDWKEVTHLKIANLQNVGLEKFFLRTALGFNYWKNVVAGN